jgi:hypothetical protein
MAVRSDWDAKVCEAATLEANELLDLAAREGDVGTPALGEALRRIRRFEVGRGHPRRAMSRFWQRRTGRPA